MRHIQGKTPTVANKKIDASTSKFGTKNNIRDMALWSRDRVEQVPCGIPTTGQLLTRAPMKQGILNRSSSPSSKAKYGHYVVTPSGILHCFKIKAFAKKKKAGLEADLVHVRLVKEGTKELGFERKLPLYRYVSLMLYIHSTQHTHTQNTHTKKVSP